MPEPNLDRSLIANPPTWPNGARCAVALTFDVDTDSMLHYSLPETAHKKLTALSWTRYDQVAVPRIELQQLDIHAVPCPRRHQPGAVQLRGRELRCRQRPAQRRERVAGTATQLEHALGAWRIALDQPTDQLVAAFEPEALLFGLGEQLEVLELDSLVHLVKRRCQQDEAIALRQCFGA